MNPQNFVRTHRANKAGKSWFRWQISIERSPTEQATLSLPLVTVPPVPVERLKKNTNSNYQLPTTPTTNYMYTNYQLTPPRRDATQHQTKIPR